MRQLYEYHPVVGYRFIPYLKARIPHEGGGYLLQTNACGFRSNRQFYKLATRGLRRVLVFGDSFTAGDGVANQERYTDLLESAVADTEMYNFGLSSTGTDQQYLAWREFASDIEADVLVIAVFVENVRRVAARYRRHRDTTGRERLYAKPYYTLESGQLRLHHVPPPAEGIEMDQLTSDQRARVDTGGRFARLRSLVTALGARDTIQRMTRYQSLPAYDSARHPDWLLMRAILAQWVAQSKQPVILMPLPLPQHLDEVCDAGAYQARFAELAAELQCVLHDPLPDFLAYPAAERRRFRWETDIHFTPAGHIALARSLAPTLERVLAQHRKREA